MRFSIIIPNYNCDKYIKECLDSIFNQTFKDYEVIVIDDVVEFMRKCERKSIPIEYCEKIGIEIEVIKKRINNSFNIKRLLDEI